MLPCHNIRCTIVFFFLGGDGIVLRSCLLINVHSPSKIPFKAPASKVNKESQKRENEPFVHFRLDVESRHIL